MSHQEHFFSRVYICLLFSVFDLSVTTKRAAWSLKMKKRTTYRVLIASIAHSIIVKQIAASKETKEKNMLHSFNKTYNISQQIRKKKNPSVLIFNFFPLFQIFFPFFTKSKSLIRNMQHPYTHKIYIEKFI